MDEIIPVVNMVVYLATSTLQGNGKKVKNSAFLGGHGYTYDTTQEGKKKLVKDTPTSTGYYTGNPNRPNTVIVVKDIVQLTAEAQGSELEAMFNSVKTVLEKFVEINSEYRNLFIVTAHKELEYLLQPGSSPLDGEGCLKLGKTTLSVAESQLARTVYELVQEVTRLATPGLVFVDLNASAEGGMGARETHKQLELAEVMTTWGTSAEVNLTVTARKEYENPESDFVKIVSATKWYADTHNKQDFYEKNGEYRVYDFGKVEPKKGYFGKITPDVTYSRLYSLQPVETLDKLFEYMSKRIANPEGYLAAGDIRTITSKDVVRLIDSTPGVPDKRALVSPITRGNDRPVLMELIVPIQMTYRIRDSLKLLDIVLHAFLNKGETNQSGYLRFKDITDLVFVKEVNGKGVTKLKLHPEFTQAKLVFNVEVDHPKAIKPVKLMLSIGFDLPERNAFNSVTDPDAEVWVVTDVRNDAGLRYLTVVKTAEYIYVHTSAEANLHVLTLGELGKKRT